MIFKEFELIKKIEKLEYEQKLELLENCDECFVRYILKSDSDDDVLEAVIKNRHTHTHLLEDMLRSEVNQELIALLKIAIEESDWKESALCIYN